MSNKALLTMGWLLVVLAALSAGGAEAVSGPGQVVTATINGLEIALDAKTGSILGLSYPGPGKMLQTTPDAGGILDLACPQGNHPALRRASRFSSGAKISQTASKVTIQWENVGTSEPSADATGPVAATVILEAAPDGRSMTASCRIENRSAVPITQVLFPDLIGLTPFGGTAETFFRTGCSVIAPFANLRPSPPEQLVGNPAVVTFLSGSSYGNMGGRWMDFGSLAGGLSLFPKCWWPEPDTKVLLHRWNTNDNLRWVIAHDVKLAPGANWESGQFVLDRKSVV